jgi:hypothetical protein
MHLPDSRDQPLLGLPIDFLDNSGNRIWFQETSVNVRVTMELREKLEQLAANDKRTPSGYVEKVLREHVEQHEKTGK